MNKIKFWVGLAGALVTTLLEVLGPDGTIGRVLTIATAVITAVAIYAFPNLETASALRRKAVEAQEAGRL
jgi:hypothetical protein